jgi:hypothetical protein
VNARVVSWTGSDNEFRLYRWPAKSIPDVPSDQRIRVNNIADLLSYVPVDGGPPLTDFLRDAVQRLEGGGTLFSYVENGLLVHYSWLTPPTKVVGTEFGHRIAVPDGARALWDDYTHPVARGRGLHKESLVSRIRVAAAANSQTWCVIGVRADNVVSRRNIERMGFEYSGSAWLSIRRGRTRRWVEALALPFSESGPPALPESSTESSDEA